MRTSQTVFATIAYALALAYLSFLPFELLPLSFHEAWLRFRAIPFMALDAFDRADLIANLVLYAPLGFLAAAAFRPTPTARVDLAAIVPAFVVSAIWAVAVEFLQVFFAPRTVSINDILAEWAGAMAGALLWSMAGTRAIGWSRELAAGGRGSANALLTAYAVGYLVLSLFPYDFLVSWQELEWKIASDRYGLWLAPGTCNGVFCAARLMAEVIAAAPLGWWFARSARGAQGRIGIPALLAGLVLGAAIEVGQFFIVSGIAQGVSVATRAAGFVLGAIAFEHRRALGVFDPRRYAGWLLVVGAVLYLAVVGFVNGWFTRAWLSPAQGLAQLPEVSFLPFYYHYYYTSEALALKSILVHGALYVPVGLGWWLWRAGRNVGTGAVPAVIAAGIAAIAEGGKLFIDGRHPDPTDVLVAGFAAWATVRLMGFVSRQRAGVAAVSMSSRTDANASAEAITKSMNEGGAAAAHKVGGALLLALAGWSLWTFPVGALPLAAALALYVLALTRWPQAWAVVVPAMLPVLDLAPWTGRFFWDEIDILLATTTGTLLIGGKLGPVRSLGRPGRIALALFVVSAVLSAGVGLLPLKAIDANAFSSYLSSYNALRQFKPIAWALVLFALMLASTGDLRALTDRLFLGIALGNVAATASVILERAATVGLLDFTSDYRVSGLMSAMHTGGAYVDGFLVLSLPFALLQFTQQRALALKGFWALACLAGVYAVFVTFSRGALMGVAAGAIVWAGAFAVRRVRAGVRSPSFASLALGLGFVVALAGLGAGSPYMRERAAASGSDLDARLAHWNNALDSMSRSGASMITGAGIGRFPAQYFWGRSGTTLPSYRVAAGSEPRGNYLQLGGGAGLYVEQRVPLDPGATYSVSFLARTTGSDARLSVALCEKGIVQSVKCSGDTVSVSGDWRSYTARIGGASPKTGTARLAMTVLSFQNPTSGTVVDLDGVSMITSGGVERVGNGGFEEGMDRWFIASDDHLAWHAKNLYLHLFIETGILGLAAFLVLVAYAGVLSARAARSDSGAGAVLASLAGFLTVGLGDSLIDSPRLLLALLLVVIGALCRFGTKGSERR